LLQLYPLSTFYIAEKPLSCSRVPYQEVIYGGDNSTYSSGTAVNLYNCDGGCGQDKRYCCQPKETEPINVQLIKAGEEPINKEVWLYSIFFWIGHMLLYAEQCNDVFK